MRRTPLQEQKLRVFVKRGHTLAALKLLRETFGPHQQESLAHVMRALEDGLDRLPTFTGGSRYDVLLTQSPAIFAHNPTLLPHAIKNGAHAWARYYGHKIATRRTPTGDVMVWLVSRNAR